MANVKITELAQETNPASDDVLPIVDVDAAEGGGETKKITIADLLENAGDGSAGAPAFAFDNDADTGMYSAGANALGFTTGGTGRLFINSNGHAGIGTSSPDRLVHIFKGEAGTAISDSNTALMIENSTHAIIQMASPNNFSNRILFGDPQDADAGKLLYDHSNNSLQFYVNASERVRIDSSGNVGIGTASPSSDLDVFNTGFVNLKVRSSGTNTAALNLTNSTRNYSINSSGGAFTFFDATASSERMRIDSSGRLLIGASTSPTGGDAHAQNAPLLIQGRVGSDADSGRINLQRGSAASADSSIGTISFTDSSNNAYARIAVEADAATGTDDYPGRIKFQTTTNGQPGPPTTRLTIKNDGNIGIGTVTPPRALTNASSVTLTTGTAPQYRLNANATDTADDDRAVFGLATANNHFVSGASAGDAVLRTTNGGNLLFGEGTSETLRIDSSGRLGLGTTTPSTYNANLAVYSAGGAFTGVLHSNTSGSFPKASAISLGSDAVSYTYNTNGTTVALTGAAHIAALQSASSGATTDLAFFTTVGGSVSEKGRIDGSGNVGIGTSDTLGNKVFIDGGNVRIDGAPSTDAVLQIRGDNTTSSSTDAVLSFVSYLNNASGGSNADIRVTNAGSGFGQMAFATRRGGGANTEAMRIDSSGRLLLGSSTALTSPTGSRFQISGDNFANSSIRQTRYESGVSGASLILSHARGTEASPTILLNGDELGKIRWNAYDGTDFESVGAEIKASIDGTILENKTPSKLVFSTTAANASDATVRLSILSDGNIVAPQVYASTTASAANVNVNSNGYLIRSISSIKFKKDIETIEDTYSDALLNCRPVWYRSKSEYDNQDWGYWGFIAEEVAEIDPRLVSWKTTETTYDEDGTAVQTACDPEPEGVQYDRFVPHLLNLIKRQKEQIETLEQRLTDAGL